MFDNQQTLKLPVWIKQREILQEMKSSRTGYPTNPNSNRTITMLLLAVAISWLLLH